MGMILAVRYLHFTLDLLHFHNRPVLSKLLSKYSSNCLAFLLGALWPSHKPSLRGKHWTCYTESQLPYWFLFCPGKYKFTLKYSCLREWKHKKHIIRKQSLVSLEAFLQGAGKGFQNMVISVPWVVMNYPYLSRKEHRMQTRLL